MQMNANKRKLLQEMELLIIDEVSMLRSDLLDAIDVVLRHVRRENNKSFGGVQVLFIGDLLQLPPVVKDDEWGILKDHYRSIYFFDSQVLKQNPPIYLELEKVFRQSDDRFIGLLNNLRNSQMNESDVNLLNEFYKPNFDSKNSNAITLTTHNNKASSINLNHLQSISGKSYFFEGEVTGDFSEYSFPVEKKLELKLHAQVMFVKNDQTGAQRFFNGKIGKISKISDQEIEVNFADDSLSVVLEKYVWENIKFGLNEVTNEVEEKVVGSFKQFPVKLAWAITVHKSQGLTFDKAILDVNDAFAPGQVYVALSRLRSLQGLVLTSPIKQMLIAKDDKISNFANEKAEVNKLEELINTESGFFLRNYLFKCFDFTSMIANINSIVSGDAKDEKRSLKQRYLPWLLKVQSEIQTTKDHADKFIQQLNNILHDQHGQTIELLHKRVEAAGNYFVPILSKFSSEIIDRIKTIQTEKKNKTLLAELFDLELLIYEQKKWVLKGLQLCNKLSIGEEFSKADVKMVAEDKSRLEKINELFSVVGKVKDLSEEVIKVKGRKEKTKSSDKEKKPKKEKINTKEESYKLFRQGKSVEDIAELRSMVPSTIEGHLAHYVTLGELNALQFISEEKLNAVISTARRLDSMQQAAIKQAMGDECSYSEIRFALASMVSTA